MNLEVKIEIRSTVEKKANCSTDGNTHNFMVYVQGLNGNQIKHFIKKIVFYLPFNSNSEQVRRKPPYFIQGSTHTSFRLLIDLFLNTSPNIMKRRYSYYLFVSDKPLEKSVCVKTLTFRNTPHDYKEKLLLGGAKEVDYQENSGAVATSAKCKSEPVEMVENQEIADSEITSERSDEQTLYKIEPAEEVSTSEEFHKQLPNAWLQSKDVSEQSSSPVIRSTYCLEELLQRNGILKKENETLNKKSSSLESLITTYIEKLPVLQNKFSSVTEELNELNQKAKTNEVKLSTLKSDVQMLMSEILQYKNKANEVTGKRKRQGTSAILNSSLPSENFKSSLSLENKSATNILSSEMERTVMNKSINKELYKHLNEESVQHYAKDKQSELDALMRPGDAGNIILNPEKSKTVIPSIQKLSTQNDCLFRQAHKNVAEEVRFQNHMRNEQTTSLPKTNKEVSHLNPKEMDSVLSDFNHMLPTHDHFPEKLCNNIPEKASKQCVEDKLQIITKRKNKEQNDSCHKKRCSLLTFVQKDLHQNAIEETANKYKNDVIQEFSSNEKDTELAALSCSKRDVITSNTQTLSITKDESQTSSLKTKDIESVNLNYQEKDSVLSNSSHLENSPLNRERAKFLPISDDRKELCRASTSVQRNDLAIIQSFSPCISAKEQLGKFMQNSARKKHFKNPKNKTNPQITNIIQNVFKDIDEKLISDSDLKSYVHSLFQVLVNPANCPNISTLVYLVINHLFLTRRNYLKAFKEDQANCIFLPSSENCIVTTLFEIEKKSKTYTQLKLIKNILSAIHTFVMTKKKYMHGLASFCRVFSEICKRKKDLLSPLSLCADILKMRHMCAPYLIASIFGVWKEPFMVPSDHSDERMILIGAISLGVQGRVKEDNCIGKSFIKELILEYFGFPTLPGVDISVNVLKDKIISNCTENSYEKSWMLTSSLVILASRKPWIWTKEQLIEKFILPNLSRFSTQEPNEKAFGLFCELYVDVYFLHPNIPNEESLIKYFEQASYKGIGFVKDWAKVSLMKYLILKKRPIPRNLTEWLEKNKARLSVETFNEFYVRRKTYPQNKFISLEDIVIT